MRSGFAFITLVAGLASIALIAASMGTETWTIIHIERNLNDTAICKLTRTLGLFNGNDKAVKNGSVVGGCLFAYSDSFSTLATPKVNANEVILYCVIVFCSLGMVFGVVASGVASYNLFSRPYETWAGPIGLISYFLCGLIMNLVAVILYIVMGFIYHSDSIPECVDVNEDNFSDFTVCKKEGYKIDSWEFGYSFYILIAAFGPFLLGLLFVFIAGKNLKTTLKKNLCPGSMKEKEEMEGNDNIMMF